jgi:exopolyphosphatase/guanosine-5'-triphosphate,3'-diphosphate pyrophosphatase
VIVAVVDVGSNSLRLLVANVRGNEVRQLRRDRVYARLGDDVCRYGHIGREKLELTESVAARYARVARKAGAERLQTIVTAPGRQAANGDELIATLAGATRAPVVLLDADDEGRLAWTGAVSRLDASDGLVAVVDLGGGSCEVAVGAPDAGGGPAWVRSRNAGALRVTRTLPVGRLSRKELERARDGVRRLLDDLSPPSPEVALAVGGTARALGRIAARRLSANELDELAKAIARKGATRLTEGVDITAERTETLLGGTLVLAEVARLLDSPLEVGRGGLREGAALSLARAEAAVA